ASPTARNVVDDDYVVVSMGDNPEMAGELVDLIAHGPKRATACLLRDVTVRGDPMPIVGGHVMVTDGAGRPRCIWQTIEVTIKSFAEIDDAFAWYEGEGDRTRADWIDGHRRCFERQA